MEVHVENVLLEVDLDLLGPVRILERVEGVLKGLAGRRHVGNHHRPAVTTLTEQHQQRYGK